MSRKKPLRALAAVAFAMLPVGSAAFASDIKIMPSSACQPREPLDAANVEYEDGAIMNTSDTIYARISCPFVKDNPQGIGQTFSAVVEVQGSQGQQVLCTLTNLSRSGKAFTPDDFGLSGANGPGSIALNLKAANSFGSYFDLTCTLPPGGGKVFSYRTVEPSPTDAE
jgi:hypothetical protein